MRSPEKFQKIGKRNSGELKNIQKIYLIKTFQSVLRNARLNPIKQKIWKKSHIGGQVNFYPDVCNFVSFFQGDRKFQGFQTKILFQ